MKLVVVESPYAGDVKMNLTYARSACFDCVERGEAPFASHLLYTQFLDDSVPSERRQGMVSGFMWGAYADTVVVYTDLGISKGMQEGVDRAEASGKAVEYRTVPGWGGR